VVTTPKPAPIVPTTQAKTGEQTILVEYRIIHGHSNDYTSYDLAGTLTWNQLAKIMVRTLTDQKFELPYDTADR